MEHDFSIKLKKILNPIIKDCIFRRCDFLAEVTVNKER